MGVLTDLVKNLGPARLVIMGAVILGLLIFMIFLSGRLVGTGDMGLLYAGLDSAESSRVIAHLEAGNVPYEVKGGGTQIFVPKKDVMSLRLLAAEQGLVSEAGVGYEIFDQSETLGTTNFIQNINHVRALEGELARTIRAIDAVDTARVHIVIPRRQLFVRSADEPSATVVVKIRRRADFPSDRVRAIQSLVATSVPGLRASRITVVDSKGQLLARGNSDEDEGALSAGTADEARQNYENRLARMIEDLLERTVGMGKVKAEVNADMDFDRVTTNSESYDPEGQVVRSTQTVAEEENSQDGVGDQPVTVENNLPDGDVGGDQGQVISNATSSRTEETVNYEISRTVSNHIRESGTLNRLSVAVLVDGIHVDPEEEGGQTYRPRTSQELETLAVLVRSAVGYNAERGDTVEVINMPFASLEDEFAEDGHDLGFLGAREELFRLAEVLVLAVIALLSLLLVVRPLLMRALESAPLAGDEDQPGYITDQSAAAIEAPGAGTGIGDGGEDSQEAGDAEAEEEFMILDRVEGQIQAAAIEKIGTAIDEHPDEALRTVRGWMYPA